MLTGASYDASKTLAQGLSGNVNLVWGWDAINPATRQKAPDQAEYDFTVDHRADLPHHAPPAGALARDLVPCARGRCRSARRQDDRLPVPNHHQLGQGPDLVGNASNFGPMQ